jgi:hypothetical protein
MILSGKEWPMAHEPVKPAGGRCAEEGDWLARQFLSADDLKMSPEEYAARRAHLWGCFSLHQHSYQDAALGEWIRRLGEILFDEAELERCRRRFLTPEELAEVRRQAAEPF